MYNKVYYKRDKIGNIFIKSVPRWQPKFFKNKTLLTMVFDSTTWSQSNILPTDLMCVIYWSNVDNLL